jgi:hypothetical protein
MCYCRPWAFWEDNFNRSYAFTGDSIQAMAKVDSGKTVSDFMDMEIAKKMSIRASLSFAKWRDNLINIIDTPVFLILLVKLWLL